MSFFQIVSHGSVLHFRSSIRTANSPWPFSGRSLAASCSRIILCYNSSSQKTRCLWRRPWKVTPQNRRNPLETWDGWRSSWDPDVFLQCAQKVGELQSICLNISTIIDSVYICNIFKPNSLYIRILIVMHTCIHTYLPTYITLHHITFHYRYRYIYIYIYSSSSILRPWKTHWSCVGVQAFNEVTFKGFERGRTLHLLRPGNQRRWDFYGGSPWRVGEWRWEDVMGKRWRWVEKLYQRFRNTSAKNEWIENTCRGMVPNFGTWSFLKHQMLTKYNTPKKSNNNWQHVHDKVEEFITI